MTIKVEIITLSQQKPLTTQMSDAFNKYSCNLNLLVQL